MFSNRNCKLPVEELANESWSTHITIAADMVFSHSRYLSGVCLFYPVAGHVNCNHF